MPFGYWACRVLRFLYMEGQRYPYKLSRKPPLLNTGFTKEGLFLTSPKSTNSPCSTDTLVLFEVWHSHLLCAGAWQQPSDATALETRYQFTCSDVGQRWLTEPQSMTALTLLWGLEVRSSRSDFPQGVCVCVCRLLVFGSLAASWVCLLGLGRAWVVKGTVHRWGDTGPRSVGEGWDPFRSGGCCTFPPRLVYMRRIVLVQNWPLWKNSTWTRWEVLQGSLKTGFKLKTKVFVWNFKSSTITSIAWETAGQRAWPSLQSPSTRGGCWGLHKTAPLLRFPVAFRCLLGQK